MTERSSDDDAALEAALSELSVPPLSAELEARLQAIPARANVRRLPRRALRNSALGWAAAAALGLFLGTRSLEGEAADAPGVASAEMGEADGSARGASSVEDEALELAVGSFAELEEEP